MVRECVVVGAGPAGLAAAGALAAGGARPLILERDRVAASWRHRYDRVHLNSSSWFSHLPGYRFPAPYGRFPSRDELVSYYEGYVRERRLELRTGTAVRRLSRHDGRWRVETSTGAIEADRVIVATGKDHTPTVPDWPGRADFRGELLHAAAYRNPEPYRGRRVVVVGAGNSGAEIVLDLGQGGAARAILAVRTPPTLIKRSMLGIPNDAYAIALRPLPARLVDELGWWAQRMSFGDLCHHGFVRPPEGLYTRLKRDGTIPTIVTLEFRDAVRDGLIEVVAGVRGLTQTGVVLEDGRRLPADVVLAATGYSPGLEDLVGHLGVLDAEGCPRAHGPDTLPGAPRLHFVGFTHPISGNIRETRLVAERLARAVVGGGC